MVEVPERQSRDTGCAVAGLSVVAGVIAGLVGCMIVMLLAWPRIEKAIREEARQGGARGSSAGTSGDGSLALGATTSTTLTIDGGDTAAIKQAIANAMPAVVQVSQRRTMPLMPPGIVPPGESTGSGFIFDGEKGFVLTNSHVVSGGEEVYVKLASARTDEDRLVAHRLAVDPYHDLAVLKVETEEKLPQVSFGNSEALNVGDWVIALGAPFGLDQTATLGIVSAKHRQLEIEEKTYDDLIQTDAAINMGNSGGPLVNLNGEVVGINSVIQSPTGTSIGIGFAIASSRANVYVNEMMSRGYLGVTLVYYQPRVGAPSAPAGHHCQIAAVLPGGPADRAGLRADDVFIAIDGQKRETMDEVYNDIGSREPGTKIEVEIFRPADNSTKKIGVEVGDRRKY